MKKTNIAELLKDCPQGMELDCLLLDNVTFERVTEDGIWIKHIDSKSCEWSLLLCNDGSFPIHNLGSLPTKCVLFPKGKTAWEGFQRPFKDGDIVFTTLGNIAIIRKPIEVELFCVYGIMVGNGFYKDETAKVVVERHATEEEKQKLFDAIKENGYRWNFQAKRLEELIAPIFKKGDKVRVKNGVSEPRIIDDVCDTFYTLVPIGTIDFTDQDRWELASDKLIEPNFKVGDIIQDVDGYKVEITKVAIDDECYEYISIIAKGIGSIPFKYQNEWNLVSNKAVEAKFKVGDWITNGEYTWKVISVDKFDYTLQDQWGEYIDDTIDYVNKAFHLWAIQDAKGGDVLAFDDDTIVIFKDLYNSTSFHSYCHIENGIFDINKDELPDWWNCEGFEPAIKELRALLSQKMKKAGYKWDTEKKELRKEEVK